MKKAKTTRDKKCFLAWYKKYNGSISKACEKAGWGVTTYYRILKSDDKFRTEIETFTSNYEVNPVNNQPEDALSKEIAMIKAMFEKQNRYDPSLDWQIENVAMLHLKVMQEYNYMQQPEYESVKMQTSREGDAREVMNGHEGLYQRYMELYQSALKNLCMTTESKPIKESGNNLNDFLETIKNGTK